MDNLEVRPAIAQLPPTAQSKPILDAMLTRLEILEGLQSSPHAPTLAAMQQEIDARKSDKSPAQAHGLCGDSTCEPCMSQGQELVSRGRELGRESVLADIDTALAWGYGDSIQEKIALAVSRWIAAGRPQPGSAPALASDSLPESERYIALE